MHLPLLICVSSIPMEPARMNPNQARPCPCAPIRTSEYTAALIWSCMLKFAASIILQLSRAPCIPLWQSDSKCDSTRCSFRKRLVLPCRASTSTRIGEPAARFARRIMPFARVVDSLDGLDGRGEGDQGRVTSRACRGGCVGAHGQRRQRTRKVDVGVGMLLADASAPWQGGRAVDIEDHIDQCQSAPRDDVPLRRHVDQRMPKAAQR
eukprot:1006704-Prymnesium_polylepis.2